MNVGRLCVFIVCMLCASGAALSQTVGQTAKLPENQQRAVVTGLADNAIKNLASHTDRSGKAKSAAQYQLDRALANFARAFFTQDTTHPNDAPPGPGAVLLLIQKDAAVTPDKAVSDAMGGLVDQVFAHFYTNFYTADKKADFAKKPDADQVTLFRVSIEIYQNDRAYQRVIKQLEDRKSAIRAQLKKMYDNSVILADGRHTLRASNGDFMVVPEDPNDRAAEVKLEGPYRDEAQRLYDCMNANGITNGLKGRELCAKPNVPAQPAAPPPPAAPPAAPPASPPDDDPFGSGGGITPPTTFNALLCVSADLASNSEWSNPEGGSKMDTFKHRVGSYVNSVAKPGWEYWIMPGQYERFDPATTSSGAQFVSVVSPDSGRFDEFNPKCPSGYAAFWVKVSH